MQNYAKLLWWITTICVRLGAILCAYIFMQNQCKINAKVYAYFMQNYAKSNLQCK